MGQKDSLPNRDNVLQDSSDILSPIMKLNQDVLWRIFSVNANMDNDEEFRVYAGDKLKYRNIRALFITWHSSQVCQLWRHFILETSSLWAQLIDLDGLSSVDGLMKDEIMRRTGSCALSISGRVFGRTSSEQNFFVAILRRDWTRIRSFKVTIAQSKSIPGIIWNILSEPTNTLEYFRLRADSGINPPDEHRPISNLFSNHAPSLRSFGSWRINFNFESGTNLNWLSNIHQLNISYMTSMSLAQWLQALEQMPQLEDLQLIYPFPTSSSPESDLKLPSVHLPRLLNLYIIHDLTACAVFLDRILPGVGCYLYLDTPDDIDNPPPPSTLVLATKVLARFSQNWFASHAV
ncbi:hypothetical protein CVT25_001812 [Psilocybe cyanescens]|uniref:F-box domain-containing protein n=1 Tax=Psilocybe cyanescens TaxID=93625 RepID=A0A409WQA1_PSICY|nr:hypothetical protein CVT25_001812 [Psilocybe cyanescens]